MRATLFRSLLAGGVLALSELGAAPVALAQAAQGRPPTTEELGKDPGALRQLEEQRNAQQLRQQQGQQQQQQDQLYNDALRQQRSRQQADVAQGQAVLRSWQQRPPLAADHNPLLGRWTSQGSGGHAAANGNDIAALANALVGGITAGLCDSMLGRGLIEFRPTAVVAIGRDGRERPMYRADYRGGGSRVVVLPQPGQSFTHMIIDFNGPDRATVAAVGCVLVRAGSTVATPAGPATSAPAELQWALLGTSAANGGMDVYVARTTIRRSGHSAQMWDLWDFKTAHQFEGKRFLSARNQYEYDCAGTRRRMLSTVGYSGHMGQGTVIGSGNRTDAWEAVPQSGPIRDYWNIACAKS